MEPKSLQLAPERAPVVARHRYPNPVRGRINAVFFAAMDWYMHWKYADRKTRLFADLPPVVVELGSGAGANFRYLRRGTKVIAVEPNVHMHRALARNAQRWGIELEIRGLGAEGLPLPDGSVEAIVSTLTLCSVDDPARVVSEVRRVLAPGGRFVCLEHVAAPPRTFIGRLQRLVLRPWRWFFEGCHTHRDTARTLEEAGFSRVAIERFTAPTAFLPIRPQIAAVCTR
jgi:SAM-dependent methyltransferase